MATGDPVCPRCGRMMVNGMEHAHMNCSPNNLPTVDDIIGLAPNFTGGVPSEEYVRKIRDGNNLPWPAEIDRLRAENVELKRKLSIAVPALEWYEDMGNWVDKPVENVIGAWASAINYDSGQKAHEALKAMRDTDRKQDVDVCE